MVRLTNIVVGCVCVGGQMEGIEVPMSRGSMNDIVHEPEPSQSDSVADSLSTQGARQIHEREAHIVVDYSQLDDDYKDVCNLTLGRRHTQHIYSYRSCYIGSLYLSLKPNSKTLV